MAAASPSRQGPRANGQQIYSDVRSKSTKGIISISELQNKARASVQHTHKSSLDLLLSEGVRSNRLVNSLLERRHLEDAYVEWYKAELYINLVLQNADTPFMNDKRRDIFTQIRRLHANQRPEIKEIEDSVGYQRVQPGNGHVLEASAADMGGSGQGIAQNRGSAYANMSSGTNGERPSTFYDASGFNHSNGISNQRPNVPERPVSSPAADPLMERFKKMRPGQPIPATQNSSSIPESLRPARPVTPNGGSNGSRPVGPRPMPPPDKELPSTPPRLSTMALLNSLPRAPSPIYTPIKGAQNPDATPPRSSSMAYGNPRGNRPDRRPFAELKTPNITAEELFNRLKEFKLLLIDVRPRDEFDEGHIHARNIICVEPITLQHPLSLDALKEEPMLYAPDSETALLERLPEFDLIVFYDQRTSNPQFLRGTPQQHLSPSMRYLYDAFVDFNEDVRLQRDPVYLQGGIDAWVDLVSKDALQSSSTGPTKTSSTITIKRKPHRNSLIGARSVRDVRSNRLANFTPMTPDEARKWSEKAQTESSALPALSDYRTNDGDSMASQAARETFVPIQSVSELLAQTQNPMAQRQSMTSPVYPYHPPPQRQAPPPPPLAPNGMPSIPSRPAPTASRPSYSGVSDHRAFSQAPTRANAAGDASAIYQPILREYKVHKTGLYNFGSTCYMNSVLQCLGATVPLTVFFLRSEWEKYVVKNWKGSNGLMPTFYYNVLRALTDRDETGTSRTIRPTSLRGFCARLNSTWGSDGQQDAQEFLLFLIDVLHEDLNQQWQARPLKELTWDEERFRESQAQHLVSKKEWQRSMHTRSSVIDGLFAGQYAVRITCNRCKSTFTTHQVWTGLTVAIPAKVSRTTIQECLALYCAPETIEGYGCKPCGQQTTITRRITLTRLPAILVVSFNRYSLGHQKRDTPVDFPLTRLDMQPFMADTCPRPGEKADPATTPPLTYDCYAVVRHIGADARSGHYKAACKDPGRRVWREFDDQRVRDFDPTRDSRSFLDPKQAYIVFYERANPR